MAIPVDPKGMSLPQNPAPVVSPPAKPGDLAKQEPVVGSQEFLPGQVPVVTAPKRFATPSLVPNGVSQPSAVLAKSTLRSPMVASRSALGAAQYSDLDPLGATEATAASVPVVPGVATAAIAAQTGVEPFFVASAA